MDVVVLVLIGTFAGILGTITGLGGGFIAIPVLRLFYGLAPATAAAVALFVTVANGITGSLLYLRQRRADVGVAMLIAATGIPSTLLGVYVVKHTSIAGFDFLFAGLLLYCSFEFFRRLWGEVSRARAAFRERVLVDIRNQEFRYGGHAWLTLLCGVVFGFVSSFFGIGGGIVFVVFFIKVFSMPAHVVSATATLSMLMVAPVGLVAHVYARDVDWNLAVPLAVGGLAGGQIGALLAHKLSPRRILQLTALLVSLAAVTLLLKHLF